MKALEAALIKGLLRICALLPLATARGVGGAVAAVNWALGSRARRVTEHNLALVYPRLAESERRQLARRSLAATGQLIGEMGHVWAGSWNRLLPRLEVRGDDLVRQTLASGRGVLVLAPHLGNWEVLGLHLATFGPAVSLYQPPRIPALHAMVLEARQRTGASLVPTDRTGVGALLRTLRAGGIGGILPDQVPPDGAAGLNVPFMGVPCFTSTLASRLLRRSGALAITAFAQRVQGGFILRYSAARPEVYGEDLRQAAAAVNREVEDCLRHCPEQYQWEYKRFRTRPERPGHLE
jgi:KDO2-lipid IV(A) lauroyltransferase